MCVASMCCLWDENVPRAACLPQGRECGTRMCKCTFDSMTKGFLTRPLRTAHSMLLPAPCRVLGGETLNVAWGGCVDWRSARGVPQFLL